MYLNLQVLILILEAFLGMFQLHDTICQIICLPAQQQKCNTKMLILLEQCDQ